MARYSPASSGTDGLIRRRNTRNWKIAFGIGCHRRHTLGTLLITQTDSILRLTPLEGSFSSNVPEPSTWAMMILGFGGYWLHGVSKEEERLRPHRCLILPCITRNESRLLTGAVFVWINYRWQSPQRRVNWRTGKRGKTFQRSPKGQRGPITLDRAIGGKNNGYSRANSSRLHFRFRISLRIRRSRDCIDGSTVPRSTIAVANARWIPAKPIRYVYPALIDSTDAQHGMHLWRVSSKLGRVLINSYS